MRIRPQNIAIVAAFVLAACADAAGTGSLPAPGTVVTSPSPSVGANASSMPAATAGPTSIATASPSLTPAGSSALGHARECENDELGYEVHYPGDWWANELIDPSEEDPGFTPIIACQFFAPEAVELQPNAGLPSGIAIQFTETDGVPAVNGERLSEDAVTVDERDAVRFEDRPRPSAGFVPEGSLVYGYAIDIGDGRYVTATTDNILQDDAMYEESKTFSTP